MNVFSDIANLHPPGRFFVEDSSMNIPRCDRGKDSVVPRSPLHPILLKKRWLLVEQEKALGKIMHRLRERLDGGRGCCASSPK